MTPRLRRIAISAIAASTLLDVTGAGAGIAQASMVSVDHASNLRPVPQQFPGACLPEEIEQSNVSSNGQICTCLPANTGSVNNTTQVSAASARAAADRLIPSACFPGEWRVRLSELLAAKLGAE